MFFKRRKNGKKREKMRYLVQIPTLFSLIGYPEKIRGMIIDINKEGALLLKMPSEPQILAGLHPGGKVKLSFHLPTRPVEVKIEGTIEHITGQDEMFPEIIDIGIKFAGISAIDAIDIEDFMRIGMRAVEDKNIKNKRKFARVPIDIPIIFSDSKKKYIVQKEGRIINLSATGLLLAKAKKNFSNKFIREVKDHNIILNLAFKLLPDRTEYQINAQGEVIRIDPGKGEFEDSYCLGIEFIHIDKKDQKNIIKFVSLTREKFLGSDTNNDL